MMLAVCVYNIWNERNCRIFKKIVTPPKKVVRLVIQDIMCIVMARSKLATVVTDLNYYPPCQ